VSTRTRLSGQARREAIIEAARRVFSEKGFYGATTRELATEAKVSEALLFKHFPNKQAMYTAMLENCFRTEFASEYHRLLKLEPSTSTLILMLHFLCSKMILGDHDAKDIHRLMLRSLSEDGEFMSVLVSHIGTTFIPKLRQCREAAAEAGDLCKHAAPIKNSPWLTQHLVLMLGFMRVPQRTVVEYRGPREKLVEEAVTFCLRGLGVSDDAVAKHYNPRAFALLAPVSA
jgi:AcrR family transcriptional regulator